MKLRVVTDSITNVPDDWRQRLAIIEVPAVINFGLESFLNDELTLEEVYRRIELAPRPPTTAQPSPQQFLGAYKQAAAEGADEIIAIVVTGELSGTLNSALAAAEWSPVPVHVWDSRHVSMAAGWQTIEAAELVRAGRSLPEILDRLGWVKDNIRMAFAPANLKYIIASGRVPRLRGTVGDLLSIKPIMMTIDGKLEPVAQVRTHRRALETMMEMVLSPFGRAPLRLAVGHCNVPEQAAAYHETIRTFANVVESVVFDLGVVLAALAGPGLLGLGAYPVEE